MGAAILKDIVNKEMVREETRNPACRTELYDCIPQHLVCFFRSLQLSLNQYNKFTKGKGDIFDDIQRLNGKIYAVLVLGGIMFPS